MTLENLVRINQLKQEPSDKKEFTGLLASAIDRLHDAQKVDLSFASKFDLAYSAAHGLALAALRAAGYRSDKRYLVFQCLSHTTSLPQTQIRLFSLCHDRRNLAEYEGHMDADEKLLSELIAATIALSEQVKAITL